MIKPDASRRSRVTTVLLAAAILVGGANLAAVAATSGFTLGHRNVAGKTTTFVNHGSGPVIQLKGRKSAPPMKLNSKKKVKHLNADMVDGRSAASLANTVIAYQIPTGNSGTKVHYTFPGLPSGVFEVSYYVNRSLKPSGSASPHMVCSMSPTSGSAGQGTILTPAGNHATAAATVVVRTDAGASLNCSVQGGTFVPGSAAAGSGVFFLKVDRGSTGQATVGKTSSATRP